MKQNGKLAAAKAKLCCQVQARGAGPGVVGNKGGVWMVVGGMGGSLGGTRWSGGHHGGGWEGTQPLFINSDARKECKVSTVQIYI